MKLFVQTKFSPNFALPHPSPILYPEDPPGEPPAPSELPVPLSVLIAASELPERTAFGFPVPVLPQEQRWLYPKVNGLYLDPRPHYLDGLDFPVCRWPWLQAEKKPIVLHWRPEVRHRELRPCPPKLPAYIPYFPLLLPLPRDTLSRPLDPPLPKFVYWAGERHDTLMHNDEQYREA